VNPSHQVYGTHQASHSTLGTNTGYNEAISSATAYALSRVTMQAKESAMISSQKIHAKTKIIKLGIRRMIPT